MKDRNNRQLLCNNCCIVTALPREVLEQISTDSLQQFFFSEELYGVSRFLVCALSPLFCCVWCGNCMTINNGSVQYNGGGFSPILYC